MDVVESWQYIYLPQIKYSAMNGLSWIMIYGHQWGDSQTILTTGAVMSEEYWWTVSLGTKIIIHRNHIYGIYHSFVYALNHTNQHGHRGSWWRCTSNKVKQQKEEAAEQPGGNKHLPVKYSPRTAYSNPILWRNENVGRWHCYVIFSDIVLAPANWCQIISTTHYHPWISMSRHHSVVKFEYGILFKVEETQVFV